MTSITEVITVRSPFGGCPHCGNGGTVVCDENGLDWLVCPDHRRKWFLGIGYSDGVLRAGTVQLLKDMTEVIPLWQGERVRIVHGDGDSDSLVKLTFHDGTLPEISKQTLPKSA